MAITKVRKVVGGIGSFPGSEGTAGQVLTKLSNAPGDYGWATLPVSVQSRLQNTNNTSYVQIAQSGTESIDFFTENTLRMSIRAAGISNLSSINGTPVTSMINPVDAPSTYSAMTDPAVLNSNRTWNASKLQTLINGTVGPSDSIPPGMVMPFAGPSQNMPAGWLQCIGSTVRKSDYPDLYNAIGDTYTTSKTGFSSIGEATPSNPASFSTSESVLFTVSGAGPAGGKYIRVYCREPNYTTVRWNTALLQSDSLSSVSVRFMHAYGNGNVCLGVIANGGPELQVFHLDSTGALIKTFNVTGVTAFTGNQYFSVLDDGTLCLIRKLAANSLAPFLYVYNANGNITYSGRVGDPSLTSVEVYGVCADPYSPNKVYVAGTHIAYYITLGVVWTTDIQSGTSLVCALPVSNGVPEGLSMAAIGDGTVLVGLTTIESSVYITRYTAVRGTLSKVVYDTSASEKHSIPLPNSSFRFIASNITTISPGINVTLNPAQIIITEILTNSLTNRISTMMISLDVVLSPFSHWSITQHGSGVDPIAYSAGAIHKPAAGYLSSGYMYYTRDSVPMVRVFYDGFGIPDLRGAFVRGLDLGKGIDPGRAIGTYQEDQIKLHGHSFRTGAQGSGGTNPSGGLAMEANPNNQQLHDAYTGIPTTSRGQQIGGFGGSETRPKNVALVYCIKT